MVNSLYKDIEWIKDKHGELIKQNFDACDALICVLAYININHNGISKPEIINYEINHDNNIITYTFRLWDKIFHKKIIL